MNIRPPHNTIAQSTVEVSLNNKNKQVKTWHTAQALIFVTGVDDNVNITEELLNMHIAEYARQTRQLDSI